GAPTVTALGLDGAYPALADFFRNLVLGGLADSVTVQVGPSGLWIRFGTGSKQLVSSFGQDLRRDHGIDSALVQLPPANRVGAGNHHALRAVGLECNWFGAGAIAGGSNRFPISARA